MSGVTILGFRFGFDFGSGSSPSSLLLKNKSIDAELLKLHFQRKFIIFGPAALDGPCLLMSCMLPLSSFPFLCLLGYRKGPFLSA